MLSQRIENDKLQKSLEREEAAHHATQHELQRQMIRNEELQELVDALVDAEEDPTATNLREQLRSLRLAQSHHQREVHGLDMDLRLETQRSNELEQERDEARRDLDGANDRIRDLQDQLARQQQN